MTVESAGYIATPTRFDTQLVWSADKKTLTVKASAAFALSAKVTLKLTGAAGFPDFTQTLVTKSNPVIRETGFSGTKLYIYDAQGTLTQKWTMQGDAMTPTEGVALSCARSATVGGAVTSIAFTDPGADGTLCSDDDAGTRTFSFSNSLAGAYVFGSSQDPGLLDERRKCVENDFGKSVWRDALFGLNELPCRGEIELQSKRRLNARSAPMKA